MPSTSTTSQCPRPRCERRDRMTMDLNTTERTSALGLWIPCRDGSWRCGNVKVALAADEREGKSGRKSWFVFVLNRTRWTRVFPKMRPYGYGHQGQAKIGAALMALHQRKDSA